MGKPHYLTKHKSCLAWTEKAAAVSTNLRNRNLEAEVRTLGLKSRKQGNSVGSSKFSKTARGRNMLSFNLLEIRWERQILVQSHAKGSGRTNKTGMINQILHVTFKSQRQEISCNCTKKTSIKKKFQAEGPKSLGQVFMQQRNSQHALWWWLHPDLSRSSLPLTQPINKSFQLQICVLESIHSFLLPVITFVQITIVSHLLVPCFYSYIFF